MELSRVILLAVNLMALLAMLAVFASISRSCSREPEPDESDLHIAVRTPQTVRYYDGTAIEHVYEENLRAYNVSAAAPILISFRKGFQTFFLMRMTLENSTKDEPYVNMWIS